MNEKSFQEYLEKNFPFLNGIGIGDDAAVINKADKNSQLITKDILIENTHFKMDYFSMGELAQKAIAVNLSDIAAMGGIPEYFFLGLGMPKIYQKKIIPFFEGIKDSCQFFNISLGGGDYSSSALFFISVTMIGKCKNPILRSNAQTGDYICITKNPGESALGLELLKLKKESMMTKEELYFSEKHKFVFPELIKGQILSTYANSMLDISDGLIKDLNRILSASKKGAIIYYEKLPISNSFKKVCNTYNFNEEEIVLGGGEDYGLLFTISKEQEKSLKQQDIEYTVIGEIQENEILSIIKNKQELEIKHSGWDHF